MEEITIRVSDNAITVTPGRAVRARLKWQAPGLDIYITGKTDKHRRATVQHVAMQEAQSRRIPLLKLKSYGWL